tara:strand:+ start:115 stop:522 length:408 start_codon:yes stop_codon:yes gene_type:complete
MANLTTTQKADMRRLFEENGLTPDDVFKHQHYIIITRGGIEKIQARHDIRITYEVQHYNEETKNLCLKAFAYRNDAPDNVIETFGEVNPKNNRNDYPWAMAEKRCLSRATLKLAGLYAHGVFGEDEADAFKKVAK